MLWTALGQAVAQVVVELWTQKLRSFLNVAAFVIGGASLVVLAGLTESAEGFISSATHAATDDDTLTIRPHAPPSQQSHRIGRDLERADEQALGQAPSLALASVSSERETWVPLKVKRTAKWVRLAGADAGFLALHRLAVARGRSFTATDVDASMREAVVGARLWRTLLESTPFLDQVSLDIAGQRFSVIGVLKEKPSLGVDGPWSWDEKVIVPWTAFRASFQDQERRNRVSQILLHLDGSARTSRAGPAAKEIIGRLLRARHLGLENFRVNDPTEDARSDLVGSIVSGLLLSTALVSFLVGGFTITNASLASVAERTREIGIKRAIGASRAAITLQFLIETIASALVGGAISVATGATALWVTASLLRTRIPQWELVVPTWALAFAALLALIVGAIAGVYPAWHAARLDPIESLRSSD